jgi:FKBP-type peptidyl-prolyl cis-trans isomerase
VWHTGLMPPRPIDTLPRLRLLPALPALRSLAALAPLAAALLCAAGCTQKVPEPEAKVQAERKPPVKDEFKAEDVVVGTGAEAKEGSTVSVHYTGTLKNGTKFDSSRDKGQPFPFTIGKGEVIKGWDKGVAGMKVGGKRKLTIPYELAYGEKGKPPTIPAKATLLFDVELLEVK